MTRLPVVSGRQLAKALVKVGYLFDHQQGSISFSVTSPRPAVVSPSRIIKKSPRELCDTLFEKAV
jgi:predicted RNA binding protein YcfA (HicA-like mRNA interferase family)